MGGVTEVDTITPRQRAALEKLAPVLGADFYLVGGVAVAAHLGHRTSRDIDLSRPEIRMICDRGSITSPASRSRVARRAHSTSESTRSRSP